MSGVRSGRRASYHPDRPVVLGIDAAWTPTQPSGVALVANEQGRWRLCGAASSYSSFVGNAHAGDECGYRPDVTALLAASRQICGHPPVVVAVDMPLAINPITMRRESDNAVSRAYGARHCATHTPSSIRPGAISDQMRQAFSNAGYPLATSTVDGPSLIEVYPHPALVELARASRRLPYKAGKVRTYWPGLSPDNRLANLVSEWRRITDLLDREIDGVAALLLVPLPASGGRALKAFEDMLDAVVCAWVGICVLEGRAIPYGDHDSAIWIPAPGGLD